MRFEKIRRLNFVCNRCGTSISTPFDSDYRTQNGRISKLECPCCSENLSAIASSAYHRAYEYNEACQNVISFENNNCSFS